MLVVGVAHIQIKTHALGRLWPYFRRTFVFYSSPSPFSTGRGSITGGGVRHTKNTNSKSYFDGGYEDRRTK